MTELPIQDKREVSPSLQDRLLMAFLGPIVFNISVLVAIAVLFNHTWYARKYLFYPMHWKLAPVLVVGVVFPAIAGFMLGVQRFESLLGHLFFTHDEGERDLAKTFGIWGALLAIAYLLS